MQNRRSQRRCRGCRYPPHFLLPVQGHSTKRSCSVSRLNTLLLYALCVKINYNTPSQTKELKKYSGGGLNPLPRPHFFDSPNLRMTPHLRMHPGSDNLGPQFTDDLRTLLRQFSAAFSDLRQSYDNWQIHITFTTILRPTCILRQNLTITL